MTIHCIHTGSTGNCYLVEYVPKKYFMLDAGVPSSCILDYLKRNKISPVNIKFCLISHLHIDHLHESKFLNMYSIPTYFSKLENNKIVGEIYKNLVNYIGMYDQKSFIPDEEKQIKIEPFVVPHDAYNFAFKITLPDKKKLVYMTDFGNIRNLPIFEEKIDYFMIECNYGIETIEKIDGIVQRRSKSDTGHCSNVDCYTYLSSQPKLKDTHILLLHRSQDNLDAKVDYEIFKDLKCKKCEVCENKQKYIL